MLQKLHENIKGWVAFVVVGLLGLAFAFLGVQYYVRGDQASGKVLVKVGDKKITENEVNNLARQMQNQAIERGMTLDAGMKAQLKAQALDNLVMRTVLAQSALKSGFVATKEQAKQMIFSIPAFQENGKFSPRLFQMFLSNVGLTQQGYFNELKSQILISQVANGIQATAFVLPSELEKNYDLYSQKRSFGYMTISGHQFIPSINVTEQQIENYYKNNKGKFREPEKVSIQYIELSPKAVASSVKVTEPQIKQYYEDNIGNYKTAATWKVQQITVPVTESVAKARQKVQHIMSEIKNNKSFADLIKAHKGQTKTLKDGKISPSVKAELAKLKEGQVSQPINTDNGYVILKLEDRTPSTTKSFAEVKSQIEKLLVRKKTQQIISNLNEKLSDLTYTDPDSLKPAAKALNVPLKETKPFSHQGAKTGVAANPGVVKAAFSNTVLEQGNNSEPVTLKDGSVVVLRINQHIKARVLPLKEVAPKVRLELLNQLADAKAVLLANQLQDQINQGKDPSQLASKHQLTWETEQNIPRDNRKLDSALVKGAFAMTPDQVDKATTVALKNGDTAVLVLQKIEQPDYAKADAKEKQEFAREMQSFMAQLDYHLYIYEAKDNIKQKVYEKT